MYAISMDVKAVYIIAWSSVKTCTWCLSLILNLCNVSSRNGFDFARNLLQQVGDMKQNVKRYSWLYIVGRYIRLTKESWGSCLVTDLFTNAHG